MTQIVANPTVETPNTFAYLGGLEGQGRDGGYHNVEVHFPQLMASEPVKRWLRKRPMSTRAEYLSRFKKFLDWTRTRINVSTPEALIVWAKSQEGVTVQDLIDEYVEPKTKSVAHIATATVRSFLNRNAYRDLPKIDWASTVSFSEGYKRGEVQRLKSFLDDPVQKLYVDAGIDSGLRPNDLLFLRYKHIREDLEAGQKFVHIRFEEDRYNRKKAPGRAFLGPNTLNPLRDLIKQGRVKTDPDAKIFPFAYRTITITLNRAKTKAGLKDTIKPSYGLRKFFEACLDKVGMDHHKKMQIEGHSQGVRKSYTSRDIDELRELYGQAYAYLDLSEEAVVSNEVGELQRKLGEQSQHIESLKAQLAEKERIISMIPGIIERLKRLEEKRD